MKSNRIIQGTPYSKQWNVHQIKLETSRKALISISVPVFKIMMSEKGKVYLFHSQWHLLHKPPAVIVQSISKAVTNDETSTHRLLGSRMSTGTKKQLTGYRQHCIQSQNTLGDHFVLHYLHKTSCSDSWYGQGIKKCSGLFLLSISARFADIE